MGRIWTGRAGKGRAGMGEGVASAGEHTGRCDWAGNSGGRRGEREVGAAWAHALLLSPLERPREAGCMGTTPSQLADSWGDMA